MPRAWFLTSVHEQRRNIGAVRLLGAPPADYTSETSKGTKRPTRERSKPRECVNQHHVRTQYQIERQSPLLLSFGRQKRKNGATKRVAFSPPARPPSSSRCHQAHDYTSACACRSAAPVTAAPAPDFSRSTRTGRKLSCPPSRDTRNVPRPATRT